VDAFETWTRAGRREASAEYLFRAAATEVEAPNGIDGCRASAPCFLFMAPQSP
jgi:hypothetical protein